MTVFKISGGETAFADDNSMRDSHQLGIGEFDPRTGIAVVEQHIEAGGIELLVQRIRGFLYTGRFLVVDGHQNDLERSNRLEVFKAACQAMIDMDLRPLLPAIEARTLVIGGDEDVMTPWEVGPSGAGQQFLADHIRGAIKYVIKGSNHSTLFDGTEENCRVVTDFLNGGMD